MARVTKGVPSPAPREPRSTSHDAFIRGAPGKGLYPWQGPKVRDDLMVSMNYQQPERLKLQVAWLAAEHKMTLREAAAQALEEWVARHFETMGISKE